MLIDEVKLILRITHNKLDSVYEETATEARAEMVRAGVPFCVANSGAHVVERAVKTFVLAEHIDDKDKAEAYAQSFQLQLDQIRKSSGDLIV